MQSIRRILQAAILVAMLFATSTALRAQEPDAKSLFAHAREQAALEHKNILLDFSASWCAPCKLYEMFLQDSGMKAIHDQAFVVVHIDVGEKPNDKKHHNTPGGEELRAALGSVGNPGYPFLVITTPEGAPIINSYINGDTKQNIGYPVAPEEINWYMKMMEKGAPKMSSNDTKAIRRLLDMIARKIQ